LSIFLKRNELGFSEGSVVDVVVVGVEGVVDVAMRVEVVVDAAVGVEVVVAATFISSVDDIRASIVYNVSISSLYQKNKSYIFMEYPR
jgi:hypothetical protein